MLCFEKLVDLSTYTFMGLNVRPRGGKREREEREMLIDLLAVHY